MVNSESAVYPEVSGLEHSRLRVADLLGGKCTSLHFSCAIEVYSSPAHGLGHGIKEMLPFG